MKFKISDSIKKNLPAWIRVVEDKKGEVLEAESSEIYKIFLKALGSVSTDAGKASFEELQICRFLFFKFVSLEVVKPGDQIRARLLVDKSFKMKKKDPKAKIKNMDAIYNDLKKAEKLPEIKAKRKGAKNGA